MKNRHSPYSIITCIKYKILKPAVSNFAIHLDVNRTQNMHEFQNSSLNFTPIVLTGHYTNIFQKSPENLEGFSIFFLTLLLKR
jgi:hypothetical protein